MAELLRNNIVALRRRSRADTTSNIWAIGEASASRGAGPIELDSWNRRQNSQTHSVAKQAAEILEELREGVLMHVLLTVTAVYFQRSGWPISLMWARADALVLNASRDFTRQAKYIRQGVNANVLVGGPFMVAGNTRGRSGGIPLNEELVASDRATEGEKRATSLPGARGILTYVCKRGLYLQHGFMP